MGTQFHTVAFPLAGQHEALNLNLTAESLAVAIVDDVVDETVIGFYGEVIGL